MAVTPLTTLAKLKKLIGDDNYTHYTEPYVGAEADAYLEEFIILGSEFVRDYLPAYPNPADLAASPMIQRITTIISAWQLSHERGNPPHLIPLVNWAHDMLERYKTGQLFLHEGTRADNGPAVVNFTYVPENSRFPVTVDWWATSPTSLPPTLYHGIWPFYGGYLW